MNIVTVYPIIRGAFKDELTYWSSQNLTLGSIIDVPLRGRTIPALVGEVTSASHAKSNIKQESFVTRKIEKVKERKVVHKECIRACEKVATYYATSFSSVLKNCIPDITLQSDQEIEDRPVTKSSIASDVLVYQTNTDDRLSTYKSIVREEFARKKSVLIVSPTTLATEELFQALRKGVEDFVIMIHGGMTKKKQAEAWKNALESEHPVLVICTPYYACLPKKDISTIILERESSRGYNSMRTPYIDYRTYIEEYAKALGVRLILGDTFLRIETLHRRETGELSDFFAVSYRVEKIAELLVVDMCPAVEKGLGTSRANVNESVGANSIKNISDAGARNTKVDARAESRTDARDTRKPKKEFKIFSDELTSMIEYSEKKSEHIFIFTARRGLSPQTVCGDCGKSVLCEQCQAPVVLHQSKTEHERFFLCHHCGVQRSALEGCKNCTSWKLTTLGIGIDTVAEEIKRLYPKREVFKIDRDTVSTDKQARDVVSDYLKSKDGILLGTESSLAFLPEVTYSAIASLDSLFSIPDFRINERICHTILRILEKTTGYVLLQTRNTDNSLIKHLSSGTLSNFYREEIATREMVNYPPFSVHIKITVEDTRASAAEKMKRLQDLLEEWDPMIFPAFVPTQKGKSVLHMLLSLSPKDWPNNKLREIIYSLPKEYSVRVNPESLL